MYSIAILTFFLFSTIFSSSCFCSEGEVQLEDIDNYEIEYLFSEEYPELVAAEVQKNGVVTTFQYNDAKQCTAMIRQRGERMISRCFYYYNDQGGLEKATVDNGQGIEAEDEAEVTYKQTIQIEMGEESPVVNKPLKISNQIWNLESGSIEDQTVYEVVFSYDEKGDLIATTDNLGQTLIKPEELSDGMDGGGGISFIGEVMAGGNTFISTIWDYTVESIFDYFKQLQLHAHQVRTEWYDELQIPEPLAEAIENIGKTLFGGSYWLMGPHHLKTRVDSYGQYEVSDKVRVSFINGILNTHPMIFESLENISETHGGVKVHYVYRPTEGWTWDISRAILIRTCFELGFRSIHARLLAALWQELIEEMGGVQGGGVIIHYAHSLGGSETDRARGLLTPEEQKMIRVITFGSATLVRNEGFHSVVNLVSVNDGVSSPFLEPLGHIRNYFDPDSNVRFYSSLTHFEGLNFFPLDHALNGVTYSSLLREYGKKFLEEFGPSDRSFCEEEEDLEFAG